MLWIPHPPASKCLDYRHVPAMLHLVVLKELGEPSVWELSQGPVGEKEYSACGWDLKAKGEKPVS